MTSLIVIDSRVAGGDVLLAALGAQARVLMLDPTANGLDQIARAIREHSGLEAIHVIAHGASGELLIGSTLLTQTVLDQQAAVLGEIGSHLTGTGDILLYGCDVAAGELGRQFVQALARHTGADVGASSNATGGVDAGGDWVLESRSGAIEAMLPIDAMLLAGYPSTLAVAGSLDASFGDTGVVNTTVIAAVNSDVALSAVQQPDGKIILAGYASAGSNNNDIALLRYNTDGSLDVSFDGDGILTLPIGTNNDVAFGIVVQGDGKYVVAGWSGANGNEKVAVVRVNPDGGLDASFGTGGIVTVDIGPSTDTAFCLALQPDGKIVTGGRSWNGANDDFAVVRLNGDGSLDTSFDLDGKVVTSFGSGAEWINGIAVQPDGRIVAAGYSSNGANYDFAVARYNANGSLDTSFDGDGKVTTAIGAGDDSAYSLVLQPDGKIVVGGRSVNNGDNDFGLVRYNADGSLDTSFDGDGKLNTPIGSAGDRVSSLALQADGKIVAAGFSFGAFNQDMAVVRYNPDGSPDTLFDGDGKLTLAIGADDFGYDVLVQADGNIVVAGQSSNHVALVRLIGGDDQQIAGTVGDDTLTGGAGSDSIAGLAGADLLHGGNGADTLDGGPGADRLFGDEGNDLLYAFPGEGADSLDGGSGNDIADFGASPAGDFTIQVIGYGAARVIDANPANGNDGTYTVSAIESLRFADKLVSLTEGTQGGDVIDLSGPGGGTVAGEGGDDVYIVDDPLDEPVEQAGEGADLVRASISWTLGANLESLFLLGTADLSGTGNELANAIAGNEGSNRLDGGAGRDSLAGGAGDDTLKGGSDVDSMTGGAGSDTYYVDDPDDAVIESAPAAAGAARAALRDQPGPEGSGADIDTVIAQVGYTLRDNVESLQLAGAEVLQGAGNALGNSMSGNTAANLLSGGAGDDTLSGGAGLDVASFAGARTGYTWAVTGATVTVTDTNPADGNDGIDVLSGVELLRFANTVVALGGTALNKGDATAQTFDLRANGAQAAAGAAGNDTYLVNAKGDAAIELAGGGTDTVKSIVSWTLWDELENLDLSGSAAIDGTGNELSNRLTGNAAPNALRGYAGGDTLTGGGGADTLLGGAGDDVYVVGAGDVLAERADEGADTVRSALAWTLAENFEDLVLGGTAEVAGTGNALANLLVGNSASNTLDGGAGADTLSGGDGGDTYVVDEPGDVVVESGGASGAPDLVVSGAGRTALGALVENGTLLEASAARELVGNSLPNVLGGNSAADVLTGAGGNDTLNGAEGMDVAQFAGKSTEFRVAVNGAAVTVTDANRADGDEGVDSLSGIEVLRFRDAVVPVGGTALVTGTSAADTLDLRGAGSQAAAGAAGNDSYLVNAVGDAVIEQPGGGIDSVTSTVSWTLWEQVENLTLGGDAAIDGTGNSAANRLNGNSMPNRLAGYAGNDTLTGGAGADTLRGGAGNDTYVVGSGDRIEERSGEGSDTVQSALDWTLADNVEKLVLSGSAALAGSGNAGDNTLSGNTGANMLSGGDGNDGLLGGAGTDTLRGEAGRDTLDGGEGADSLDGGADDDLLRGGNANDTLRGGEGADAFQFDTAANASTNRELVADFLPGTDTIRLDDDVFTALVPGPLDPARFAAGAGLNGARDADDRIVYNSATGALYYDSDGTGSAPATLFAVLGTSTHPALTAADFVIVA